MVFDRNQLLERILQEAPIISNRRGEIEIDGQVREGDKWVKRKVKVPIYAYYFNRGVKDPDLKYDKVNSPIQTIQDSTLAEVYSFWEGDPNVQALRQRLEKEGGIKKGEVMYQGPWVEHALGDEEIERQTRQQHCEFILHRSAGAFERHFNKIASELGYDVRLVDLSEENYGFYGAGAYAIQSARDISFSLNGHVTNGRLNVRVPVPLDLNRQDPTLSAMLEIVESSYQQIHTTDLSNAFLQIDYSPKK